VCISRASVYSHECVLALDDLSAFFAIIAIKQNGWCCWDDNLCSYTLQIMYGTYDEALSSL